MLNIVSDFYYGKTVMSRFSQKLELRESQCMPDFSLAIKKKAIWIKKYRHKHARGARLSFIVKNC